MSMIDIHETIVRVGGTLVGPFPVWVWVIFAYAFLDIMEKKRE